MAGAADNQIQREPARATTDSKKLSSGYMFQFESVMRQGLHGHRRNVHRPPSAGAEARLSRPTPAFDV